MASLCLPRFSFLCPVRNLLLHTKPNPHRPPLVPRPLPPHNTISSIGLYHFACPLPSLHVLPRRPCLRRTVLEGRGRKFVGLDVERAGLRALPLPVDRQRDLDPLPFRQLLLAPVGGHAACGRGCRGGAGGCGPLLIVEAPRGGSSSSSSPLALRRSQLLVVGRVLRVLSGQGVRGWEGV